MMDMENPGPDYVRVLGVLPKRQWLVAAAQAFLNGETFDYVISEMGLPQNFRHDRSFLPVALGPTHPRAFDFSDERVIDPQVLDPSASEFFTVRGFVRRNGDEPVPSRIDDVELYADPSTGAFLTSGMDPAVGNINDAKSKMRIGQLAAYGGFDGSGVAVAIVDSGIFLQHLTRNNSLTGLPELTRPVPDFPIAARLPAEPPVLDTVNSWVPPTVATPSGAHRIGHGTMCAYNVLAVAPKATLLDYPILIARAPGDHTVRGTVGAALHAYTKLFWFWATNRPPGGPYKALVVNNSWGIFHPCLDFPPGHPGRYIDNPSHPFHIRTRFLARIGADIVFAAGNGGLPCPTPPFLHLTAGTIRGANASREVLTVAGCDVNDSRVCYSSQGPALAMPPLPTPQKPDLTAYTHFLGSQVFGVRKPDSGTSAACPIVAGCIAALRSHPGISPSPTPAALFNAVRNSARPVGPAGWNPDYGFGIIDPVAAARSLGVPIP